MHEEWESVTVTGRPERRHLTPDCAGSRPTASLPPGCGAFPQPHGADAAIYEWMGAAPWDARETPWPSSSETAPGFPGDGNPREPQMPVGD